MFEDLEQRIQEAIEKNQTIFNTLCPSNLTTDSSMVTAMMVFQRGPHHWIRTNQTQRKILSRRETSEATVSFSDRTGVSYIDKVVYECVYCLKVKVKE